MWIVRLALRRPYTFVVMALVIILLTPVALMRTPTDIFPEINIPVISLVWNYAGLQPHERAAALRFRQLFYPHATCHHPWRCHAFSVRRKAARHQRGH